MTTTFLKSENDWKSIQETVGANFHFEDYVSIDDDVLVTEFRELDGIIADHKEDDDDDGNQSDEDDSEVPLDPIPTRNDVLDAVTLFRRYLAAAPTDTEQVDRCLHKLENFVVSSSLASSRQSQIIEFF